MSNISPFSFFICLTIAVSFISVKVGALDQEETESCKRLLVKKKDERKLISSSQYGEVSGVSVRERTDLSYHLRFFTLEPNALFLPVVLHANMVFYVHTGSGKLSYINEAGRMLTKTLRQGDTLELNPGTIFFIEAIRCVDKLSVYAIFGNSEEHFREPATTPYSSFRSLILSFDKKISQQTFKVPEDVIEEILNKPNPPAIVSRISETKNKFWDLEARFINGFTRSTGSDLLNMRSLEGDSENHNGRRTTLNKKKLPDFKGFKVPRFGVFITNLTRGSMTVPHWNQMATEIIIVLQGKGMVQVVCSSTIAKENECKTMRFQVGEGDVFFVPRFHPTTQMSFSDDTFVFMGFSTSTTKKISHQFVVGKTSVFKTLGKRVLAASLGVNETIADMFLTSQRESIILGCNLCAEEELRMLEEEIERVKQTEPGEGKEAPEEEPGKGIEKPDEEPREGKDQPGQPLQRMPDEQKEGKTTDTGKGKRWAKA